MKEILKRVLNVCLVMFMLIVVTSILSSFLPDETEKLLVEFSWISKLVNMVLYLAFAYYIWIVLFKNITKDIIIQIGFVLFSAMLVPILWFLMLYCYLFVLKLMFS